MKHPWMPMFWGDFFANTLHLSAQEIGAYVLLIAHAWEHDAKVPVDQAHRIARINNRHWASVRARLAPFFEPPDGLRGNTLEVIHPRAAKELAITAEKSSKNRQAALQMHANRRANAMQTHMPPLSLPLNNLSFSEEENGAALQTHHPETRQGKSPDMGNSYRSPPANRDPDPPTSDANRQAAELLAHWRPAGTRP